MSWKDKTRGNGTGKSDREWLDAWDRERGYQPSSATLPMGGGYGSLYGGVSKGTSKSVFEADYNSRCHEKHPVISLLGGKIMAGSCTSPRKGFDIYIGFDTSMKYQEQRYPWDIEKGTKIVEFCYQITDMQAPKNEKSFGQMIDWLITRLKDGRSIHIGCFGGHGRSGTVLAALVAKGLGKKDAIGWVRKNHCPKAVESVTQVDFLEAQYGVARAEPTKAWGLKKAGTTIEWEPEGPDTGPIKKKAITRFGNGSTEKAELGNRGTKIYRHTMVAGNIWERLDKRNE